MVNTKNDTNGQRLYRVWISYTTKDAGGMRKGATCEVIAREAAKAIQTVLSQHHGIDVLVATIERVAVLDDALNAENN